MAYEVFDVPLGVFVGAFGYAGPFGGGEVALKVAQQKGKDLRLALVASMMSTSDRPST